MIPDFIRRILSASKQKGAGHGDTPNDPDEARNAVAAESREPDPPDPRTEAICRALADEARRRYTEWLVLDWLCPDGIGRAAGPWPDCDAESISFSRAHGEFRPDDSDTGTPDTDSAEAEPEPCPYCDPEGKGHRTEPDAGNAPEGGTRGPEAAKPADASRPDPASGDLRAMLAIAWPGERIFIHHSSCAMFATGRCTCVPLVTCPLVVE